MKLVKALIASGIFLIFLVTIYFIHIKYFKVNVIFYSAMLDSVLATLATTFVLLKAYYFREFNGFEKLQLIAIWLLIGYAIAISVPTVIDRSLSFYILEKIQQRGGGIKLSSFEKIFTEEYVKEHRLLDVRLTEAQSSGTITIQSNCVKLTERGKRLASFGRFFRKNFLPKQRLLMGEYTDDLTDPFRDGGKSPGYECK